jgi:hypothetical protein
MLSLYNFFTRHENLECDKRENDLEGCDAFVLRVKAFFKISLKSFLEIDRRILTLKRILVGIVLFL